MLNHPIMWEILFIGIVCIFLLWVVETIRRLYKELLIIGDGIEPDFIGETLPYFRFKLINWINNNFISFFTMLGVWILVLYQNMGDRWNFFQDLGYLWKQLF
jgi:hypothetical protein